MDNFMKMLETVNCNLFPSIRAWIAEGWGLQDEAEPEQLAAALLMEAKTQDECVKRGDSDPSYPVRLRRLAFTILSHYHEVFHG